MIVKSTPISPKRNRVTIHASGELYPLADAGAVMQFTNDDTRLFYATFDIRDLPALKKIIRDLEKSKVKSK